MDPDSRSPGVHREIVHVDGHRIAADLHLTADPRPPVVFFHGIMSSLALAPELFIDPGAESWIALSLPGHHPAAVPPGFTRAPPGAAAITDLLEAALAALLGDRRVVAAGWSTGGLAALNLSIRHPHRVAAVASLAGFARGRCAGIVGWLQWLADGVVGRPCLAAGLRAGGAWRPLHDAVVRRCAANADAANRVAPVTLARMHADFACHDAAALAAVLAAVRRIDIAGDLHAIRVPTWIACGERDPVVTGSESRLLAAAIPQAELRVYPGAGHLFFSEWPTVREDFAAWRGRVTGPAAAAEGP